MNDSKIDELNKRLDKLEIVVDKLTDISNNLNKLVAVHEAQMIQQEKDNTYISNEISKYVRMEQFIPFQRFLYIIIGFFITGTLGVIFTQVLGKH